MRYLLVDGHGLAFRGFYALPAMNAPDGTPTNAVLGTMNMLLKAEAVFSPDTVIFFFDPKGKTKRHELFELYKAGRRPTPDEFKIQLPLIIELLTYLGYAILIKDGIEADDMIASAARQIAERGNEAMIFSADKDLLQILSDKITMVRPSKGVSEFKMYSAQTFTEEYGFAPSAMADFLALSGDSADNIPGVDGIGDKTARTLLKEWRSIEEIYDNLDSIKRSVAAKLANGREDAFASKRLSLITASSGIAIPEISKASQDLPAARDLCSRLGLKQLSERLGLNKISVAASSSTSCYSMQIEHADIDDVIKSQELVVSCDMMKKELTVMSPDGRYASLGVDEAVPKLSGRHSFILSDIRTWYKKIPEVSDIFKDSVVDVDLLHYFFHPDGKSHRLEEVVEGQDISSSADKCLAVTEFYHQYKCSPLFDSALEVSRKIDVPLVPVLIEMEQNGLFTDIGMLRSLGEEAAKCAEEIKCKIEDLAGTEINLNSPKQVGELLFERLRLPVVKRSKTGYSTDASVLEELATLPPPLNAVPLLILEYRECSKILSGFIEPFVKHAEASYDRAIHSKFLHDATGTGRLASRDPNVQNLPAFGKWADPFRKAIRPRSDDRVFVAADYSQIELRVLAHLSKEPRLIEAFASSRDVHSETAGWVFGVKPREVTSEQRRFAKTVNFGLIYGMSAHGLAERLGMPRNEASEMIDRYFSAFPSVKEYLTRSAEDAKTRGHTVSLFGRIRPLGELSAGTGRGSAATARAAVNTPIQSTASDIAKIAMIDFSKAIRSSSPSSRIVLQVHDSIICETSESDVKDIAALLSETMEKVRALDIPLKTEVKSGKSISEV